VLLGHLKTESYLPVGTLVTIVGEVARASLAAARGSSGGSAAAAAAAVGASGRVGGPAFTIRRPVGGLPFYLTASTKEALVSDLSRSSRAANVGAMAFGALGALLCARKAISLLLRRRREAAVRKRLLDAAAARTAAAAPAASRRPGADADADADAAAAAAAGDRAPDLCVVCLERAVELVYTPCGHLCACAACGAGLARCPICRGRSAVVRVFRP